MSDDDSILSFPLIQDLDETGYTRTYLGENTYQRETSGLSIILREKHVVHGTWAPAPAGPGASSSTTEKQQKASLLVYRVELHSNKSIWKHRFKLVSLKFRLEHFEDSKAAGGKDKDLDVAHTNEKEISATLEASGPAGAPVTPKFAIMRRDKASEAWLQHALVTIQGHALKTRRHRRGDDRVEWTISENPKEATIPDAYGLAILLRRPADDSKFKMVFDFKADVDWWHDLKDMNPFKGWGANEKVYDPSDKSEQKGVEAVLQSVDSLEKLSEGLYLSENFSFMHLPEEMKPVQVYQG